MLGDRVTVCVPQVLKVCREFFDRPMAAKRSGSPRRLSKQRGGETVVNLHRGSRKPADFTNLSLLIGYQRTWLRRDVLAGVTVAAYLVPQVMAYAAVAGLPAVAGLWAMLPCMIIYAALGSSRQLSVGPESTTALLTASIVAPLAAGDVGRYARIAAELALVFGLFCLVAWLLRLGFVAELLSRPVLVGYLAGVATIMVFGQLGKVTGTRVTGDTLWSQAASLADHAPDIKPASVGVALATIAILLVIQRRWPGAPGALVAVAFVTTLVAITHLERHGVAVVGTLSGGLPRPALPSVSDVRQLLLPAVGILIVGYTDNVLTARAFATRGGYEVNANQELLALGACNLGSAAFQGFPVSSSASRTALGDAAGSRSQLYSLAALITVLITIVFFGGVLAHFPNASLGGLVIYAAFRLIDVAEFQRLARFRRRELGLALVATVGVLTFDILYGILFAVAMSVVELLSRVARPHDAVLGQVPGLAGMHDVDDYPAADLVPGVLFYRYDSPLFFANAEDFRRRALGVVDEYQGDLSWFVLNVEAIVEVDITGLDALESVRATLVARGIVVALARVKQDLLDDLEAYGLADSIGRDLLFPTLPTALAAYRAWREAQ
jgi:SulP family sulfate permease